MNGVLRYHEHYQGIVKNGKIELEDGVRIPDGTVVQITPITDDADSLMELTSDSVATGVPDLAAQHDHYLYGTPKRD